MTEVLVLSIVGLVTAILGVIKQTIDNRKLRTWICTKNPCEKRIQGEPPTT